MTITVNEVRDEFIERYPDAQDTDNAKILRLIQGADLWVCSELPHRHDTFDLSLTADDPDILFSAFPAGAGGMTGAEIARIYSAVYIRSANNGDYKLLTGRDPRWLDKYRGLDWRLGVSGEPSEFAVDAGVSGRVFWILPKPNLTTSSGYPKIRLYCSCHKVLAYGQDLAVDLPSPELFLAHMCERWAATNDRGAVMGWRAIRTQALSDAEGYLFNYIEQENPSMLPGFYPRGGVT